MWFKIPQVKVARKMSQCCVVLILVLAISVVYGNEPDLRKNESSLARPIRNLPRDRGGGFGNPADWTMSKAKLVAEFFTSEPGGSKDRLNRSQQSVMQSYFYGNPRDNGTNSVSFNRNQGFVSPPQYMVPPPPVRGDKQVNLVASGTSYSPQSVPFDFVRAIRGGFATPFRPINPQQQSFIVSNNGGVNGYFPSVRPTRGQLLQTPSQQYGWETRPINGLRPPPFQQQYNQPPAPQYLPPQLQTTQAPPPPLSQPTLELPKYDQSPEDPPAPPSPPSKVKFPVESSVFTPSQQYLPAPEFKPESTPQIASQYQPAPPPPPQVADTYSKQSVYPVVTDSQKYPNKSPVYVAANTSSSSSAAASQTIAGKNTINSFTQYSNDPQPPLQGSPPSSSSYQIPPPIGETLDQSNLNSLSLSNNPLSDVLAEANQKAGDAMDKTIRFVIHKPEDEDIIKNAILENAHNRYEDVRFVQGPTLKVQRKETVYLPPKKKTVVYILLKEPQIDTDVQVMSPDEDEPVPEVYITYQKPDGAVKTKHYSPKPMKPGDMKRYLDVEQDSSYSSPEESRLDHPRLSKSTSVSLSTSSQVSRKAASMSAESSAEELSVKNVTNQNNLLNSSLLENHRMTPLQSNDTSSLIKTSPFYNPSRAINQTRFANLRLPPSLRRPPQKRPRSSDFSKDATSTPHKRFFRTIQCPTASPVT